MAGMKKLALGMILLLGLGVAWRTVRPSDAPDAKLLFHRFWIDHEPRAPKEQFQVLFVNGEIPMGHFATRTMWTGVLYVITIVVVLAVVAKLH